jgi:hypothetical protein
MECVVLRDSVLKRVTGATAGLVIGLASGIILSRAAGYDVTLVTFIVGAPLGALLARAYGGPISEAMGREERGLTRNLKLTLIAVGALAAGAFGALTGDATNGLGLAFMLLAVSGPRMGVIFDERMARIYGKSATIAFAVFSLCAGYVGFYQTALNPELVTLGSYRLVIWVSWASLVVSLLYQYFVSGD